MGRGVCAAPGATTSTSPNHNVAKRFISLTNREGQRESGTRCRDRQGLPVSALPCHFPAVFPREGSSNATLYAHGQRASLHRLRRRRHAAALGAARQHRPHGHEVRMRHRAVRRLHRPPERRGHALLRDTDRRGRHRENHDHRRAFPRWRRHGGAPRAKGVDRRRRAAVRVLPVRAGHGGRGAAGEDARAHRRADRRRHDQHLPLRHLPAHSRRRAPRGEGGLMERRAFLQTAGTVGAGLVIGFRIPTGRNQQVAGFAPNAWLRIVVDRSEMGQGVTTALPMLLAEELEADWTKVKIEFAPADKAYINPLFGMQGTGGSTSVRAAWMPLRKAGAQAREMLITAAAQAWGVNRAECRAERGAVVHAKSRRRLRYGQLALRAGALPVPADVPLKDPKTWTILGKPTKRLDSPVKVNGRAQFGIDVRVPGMRVALVARSPVFGGKVKSFDATAAKAVEGVRDVVQISSGVAVVGTGYWPAKQGRDALQVVWDEGPNAAVSNATISQLFADRAGQPGAVARHDGDPDAALREGGGAAQRVEAGYELPFLAPATMEPMNCTAHVRPDGVDIWAPTQFQTGAQGIGARIGGVPPEKVQVHTTYLGGGFGRRFELDFIQEALEVSKAAGTPVKVIWSREDDIQHAQYRPAS